MNARSSVSLAYSRWLSTTIALLATLTGGAAQAAVPPETAAPVTTISKEDLRNAGAETPTMIVTGTRIPQPNLTSASPINVVTDQEFKLQGTTNVIDLLNTLPLQFQNSQVDFSAQTNPLTAAGGISTADLRGLGPQRTLVLVNGRRLGVGDSSTLNTNPAPDLNQIPAQLVERVEVVTGGASAVYGSDAIAGVVNFILKKNFEGIQLDAQYGFAQHTNDNELMASLLSDAGFDHPKKDVLDGRNKAFSLIMGSNMDGGRANATVYFTYRDADPVYQGSRDYSACKLTGDPGCTGSPNSNYFKVQGNPLNPGNPARGSVFGVLGNGFIPWGSADTNPPAFFNSNPYQTLSAPDTRYTAGLMAHDELSEKLDAYFEFSFMNDRASTQIAPSALFAGGNPFTASGGYLVNCDNPFLSHGTLANPGQFDLMGCGSLAPGTNVDFEIGRRNIEGGGRSAFYDHQNYRAVFGAKGVVWQGWQYDTYLQYYRTSLFQSQDHYLSNQAVGRALQVVNVNGVPTCKSVVDGSDSSCKPYNIFRDGGLFSDPMLGVTAAALDYVDTFGTSYGTAELKTLHADFTNDLGRFGFQSPWAKTGLGVNLGIEYRMEHWTYNPDKTLLQNDLSGGSGAGTIVDNSLNVREEFIELQVPIADNKPFAEELTFLAGFRKSDYSVSGSANTYKLGLQWKPVTDVRFRTMWNRAIRAPNMIELFNPQSVTQTTVVGHDPCSGATPDRSPGDCARTGVTPAQYGNISDCPASQCAILLGGNTALKPEVADTFSAGFTLTPSFLDNFTMGVDYFNISVDGLINNIPPDVNLNLCLDTGNPTFCGQVVRNPTNGILFGNSKANGGYIVGTSINIAKSTTSGIDFTMSYRYDLPGKWGSLNADFLGTYLDTATVRNLPTLPSYDCAGLFGKTCQTLNPQWSHTLRLNWQTPWNVLASLRWRYIGSTSLDTVSSQPVIGGGDPDPFDATIASANYVDVSAIWDVGYGITMRGGINNLMDKDPPLISASITTTGSPNTYPTYDLLGRVWFFGVTAKF